MKTSTHSMGFLRELSVAARQCKFGCGIPFGVALLKQVGEDGNARYSVRACLGPVRPHLR